jgi:hypothetical protein
MNYKIGIAVTLLCLFPARLTVAIPASQEESGRPGNSDTKHTNENKTKKPSSETAIPVHIKILAQGMEALPTGSTIELKGNQETCKNLRLTQNIQSGEVTFPDLPVCKVQLRIFITGFNAQLVSVDLASYKDPMRILVKSDGPPIVSWGPAT